MRVICANVVVYKFFARISHDWIATFVCYCFCFVCVLHFHCFICNESVFHMIDNYCLFDIKWFLVAVVIPFLFFPHLALTFITIYNIVCVVFFSLSFFQWNIKLKRGEQQMLREHINFSRLYTNRWDLSDRYSDDCDARSLAHSQFVSTCKLF